MDNNLDGSDIDIGDNSVFCPPSNNASPQRRFFGYNTFNLDKSTLSLSGIEDQKPLTKSVMLFGLEGLNASPQENQTGWKFDRSTTQPTQQKAQVGVNRALPVDSSGQDLENGGLFKKRESNEYFDFNNSKITSLEAGTSPVFSTECKVMTNPRASVPNNFHMKENIDSSLADQRQQTTFFLKRFNVFSNAGNAVSLEEDNYEDSARPLPISKKIIKRADTNRKDKAKKPLDKRSKRKTACNCKNSGCVKLYCECFSNNGFCGNGCRCKDCKNTQAFRSANNLALTAQPESQNFGFKIGKLQDHSNPAYGFKGCHCKKSSCLKKYCECFNYGIGCSEECCCIDCQNLKQLSA